MLSKIIYYFGAVIFLTLSETWAAPAQLCVIGPQNRSRDIRVECTGGESSIQIGIQDPQSMDFDGSYKLEFKATLFNSKRVVHIIDSQSKGEVLTINVSAPKVAHIKSPKTIGSSAFILNGLKKADLEKLRIAVEGTLVIEDDLRLTERFEVGAQRFYLLKSFSIAAGTFEFRYQNGYLPFLNLPFVSRYDGAGYAVIQSLGSVKAPSQTRIALKKMPHTQIDSILPYFLKGYREACGVALPDKHANYAKLKTDSERISYLKQYILPNISDTKKKGVIGEELFRSYMKASFPDFQFLDPKVGLNSFDAIHIRRENPEDETSAIQEVIIAEVKYAAQGNPVLGTIEFNHQKWRQLSLPYVESRLDEMMKHSQDTMKIAQLVRANQAKVKLQLAVFNPDGFDLTLYDVGNLEASLLD